ncbi:uncharacterized protein BXZ73DRAFT_104625 [Epithele typhae]|uniref:uncharacterized protein n=1 Tax=Epithele typhae TaxID=378194 RepID=UPI0020075EBB|nr:uncharacterized protein BXZ73DRAFT_104625 [Epithele typhae]KAH9920895.1 hypothetical protein BXZ73DRAFT_104625 [Epithele typhae]
MRSSRHDIGMLQATAILWFFVFGFFALLLLVPATKALMLEELDHLVSVLTHTHAA